MFGLPMGPFTGIILALVIYLGLTQRVLDRMKLNDTQALVLVGMLFIGTFLPEIRVFGGLRVDIGGAIIPLVVAGYLLFTAGTAKERLRATLASLVTAAVIIAFNTYLPHEPTQSLPIDIDPIWFPGVAAGIIGYIAGRSRRGAFIAGLTGVVLSDLWAASINIARGAPNSIVSIGGAGVLDTSVLAAVIAVLLAEIIGETREFLQGGPSKNRPPELLKGLANGDGDGRPKDSRRRPRLGTAITITLLVLGLSWTYFNHGLPNTWGNDETPGGQEFLLVDSQGQIVTSTGHIINRGDEYIDEQNRHWRVYAAKGYTAWAQNLGVLDLNQYIKTLDAQIAHERGEQVLAAPPANPKGRVGMYFTHNDESYVPTDGTASVYGVGGIHRVGDAFEQALWERNITTIRSNSLHLPHDRGAYVRSRRTAASIVQGIPDAVFDIHRDATPASVYQGTVNGEAVTKITIVVGQQNVNRTTSRKIAAGLKSISDAMYPGLVKGIFIASGNYNQDLYPTALLLEVGSHTNDRLAAERGIAYFADVVDRYLYGQ